MKRFYFFFVRIMVVLIVLTAAIFAVRVIQTVQAESRFERGPITQNLNLGYPVPYTLEVRITGVDSSAEIVISSPSGIDCGTICKASFNKDSSVKLVAGSSSPDVVFVQWIIDGQLGSTSSLLTLKMDAPKIVYAIFNRKTQPLKYLTVSRIGTKSDSVTSEPAGILCGVSCAALYNLNTPVKLTAHPAAGEYLEKWVVNNVDAGANPTLDLVMEKDQAVIAVFKLYKTYMLTVNRTGSGRVTSQPAGIDCGNTCQSAVFREKTTVTLTAAPLSGAKFMGWNLGSGTPVMNNPLTVTMDADKTIGAAFTTLEGDLVVSLSGGKNATTPMFDYTVTITNKGPDTVTDGIFTDSSAGNGVNISWTCKSSSGAACNASGSGPLATLFTLPKGGSLTYTIHRRWAVTPYTYTVTASPPVGMTEKAPADNSKSVRGYIISLCMLSNQK